MQLPSRLLAVSACLSLIGTACAVPVVTPTPFAPIGRGAEPTSAPTTTSPTPSSPTQLKAAASPTALPTVLIGGTGAASTAGQAPVQSSASNAPTSATPGTGIARSSGAALATAVGGAANTSSGSVGSGAAATGSSAQSAGGAANGPASGSTATGAASSAAGGSSSTNASGAVTPTAATVTLTGAGIPAAQQAAVASSPTSAPPASPTARAAAAPVAPTPVSIGAPQTGGAPAAPGGSIPDPGGAAPTNTPVPPTAVIAASAGIELGKPVAFVSGPVTTVGLPVKNTGSAIKSFDVKVTYGGGAVAAGRVEDIPPGQTRVATLLSMDQVPANPSSIKVDIEGMSERASSPATKVTFGTPQLRSQNGVSQLVVDVTNGDAAPHSVFIAAGFYKDADLVGLARGGVDALAPGQTRSASLLVYGDAGGPMATTRSATTGVPPYDRIEVGLGGLTN